MFPSIYISHGSPALMLMDNTTSRFYKNLAKKFEKPKYIIIISAHWETPTLKILSNDTPFLIYDFYNFPKEMYEQDYPAPNDMAMVEKIIQKCEENNISIERDDDRSGYDHGVWAPLKMIYPDADIPVIQLSLPKTFSSKQLLELGKVLSSFREDAMIIGSGNMTHNLGETNFWDIDAKPEQYAVEFNEWIIKKCTQGDIDSLVEYKTKAPKFKQNHPTSEHFTPFLVTLGASKDHKGEALNSVYMYGNQAMTNILFKN
jgi:4,5-DOPA dioxygenase extradiol